MDPKKSNFRTNFIQSFKNLFPQTVKGNSVDYLDLFLFVPINSEKRTLSYKKEFKEKVLVTLDIDWCRGTDYLMNAVQSSEERWTEYVYYLMRVLMLDIYDSISNADDKREAIRKYILPLRYTLDLIRIRSKLFWYFVQNTLFHLLHTLIQYSEDSVLLSDLLRNVLEEGNLSCSELKCVDAEIQDYVQHHSQLLRCSQLLLINIEMHDYVLYHSQKARFNMWGILPFATYENKSGHLLKVYFVKDSLEYISILVKYGGAIEKAALIPSEFEFMIPLEGDTILLKPFRICWHEQSRRKMLMNQIVYFVMVSVPEILDQDQVKLCIRIIWRALPDAYISRTELTAHMASICMQRYQLSETYWTSVTRVCDFYEDAVGRDDLDCTQPRSLRQHCRCAIRKQLFESTYLPGGITRLQLPPALQDYLNLNCKDLTFSTYVPRRQCRILEHSLFSSQQLSFVRSLLSGAEN